MESRQKVAKRNLRINIVVGLGILILDVYLFIQVLEQVLNK